MRRVRVPRRADRDPVDGRRGLPGRRAARGCRRSAGVSFHQATARGSSPLWPVRYRSGRRGRPLRNPRAWLELHAYRHIHAQQEAGLAAAGKTWWAAPARARHAAGRVVSNVAMTPLKPWLVVARAALDFVPPWQAGRLPMLPMTCPTCHHPVHLHACEARLGWWRRLVARRTLPLLRLLVPTTRCRERARFRRTRCGAFRPGG